jgi:hypothetical protein
MIDSLNRIFLSKKDMLLRKQRLCFEDYKKILAGDETVLKKQNLEREVSVIEKMKFNFDVDEETLKQEYRILVEKTNYSIDSIVLKGCIANKNLMCLPTEGEREIFDQGVIPSEDVRMSQRQGYSSYDEKIAINALWGRLRWSFIFASTMMRSESEAEEDSNSISRILLESSWIS